MQISLPCKEPDCTENVQYERKELLGLITLNNTNKSKEKAVYLECPQGHIHRYVIPNQ